MMSEVLISQPEHSKWWRLAHSKPDLSKHFASLQKKKKDNTSLPNLPSLILWLIGDRSLF